jgi:hypothetical protein
MKNLDLKKEMKQHYAPLTKEVVVVDVPAMHYLMVDGEGNPNTSPDYRQAVQALYPLAYNVRAICKAAGQSFTVMPLEGLWWFKSQPIADFVMTEADKDRFLWTMMILMPDFVTDEMVMQARQSVAAKQDVPVLLDSVRFAVYAGGEAVQIMHIGPYADEGPNIKKLHDHIAEQGWALSGKHHEIYLSDPRRAAPEKMRTVIRQPFSR